MMPKPRLADYPADMFEGCSSSLLRALGFGDAPPAPPVDVRAREEARGVAELFGGKLVCCELPEDTHAFRTHNGWFYVDLATYNELLREWRRWKERQECIEWLRENQTRLNPHERATWDNVPAWQRGSIMDLIAEMIRVFP